MDEKKLTNEALALTEKALDISKELSNKYTRFVSDNIEFIVQDSKARKWEKNMILEFIHRLQTELDTKQCIIRLLEQDVADRDKQLESKVEEVYADFMNDYKIMRDELKECYDEFGNLQAEMEETIDKQKAEIERLKRYEMSESEFQKYCAYKIIEPQIRGCLDRERELQKQVDELKELNAKYLDSIESVQAGRCRLRCELTEQAVKDTAKEIYSKVKNKSGAELSFLNDLALWIKERFGVAVEKWIKVDGGEME